MARALKSSKRKSLANAAVTTVALVAGLILINVVFQGVRARADLTSGGFFSLTAASERLVAGIDEPISVTAYFGKVPSENRFEQEYVETLLDRYADASGGKFTWRKIDPFERGREFQQQLREDHGIDKMMWVSMVDDTPQQVPVYFQIEFEYLDQSEVWTPPARFSLEGLEYDFSAIIKRLAYPKKKVAVTTGFGSPPQAQAIQAILSQNYDVEMVDLSTAEADLSPYDVLIVNGPTQPLSDAAIMLLDQHVLAGKPTLFLLRGMQFQTSNNQMPATLQGAAQPILGMPVDAGLGPLLAHYGVTVQQGAVLDARANTNGVLLQGNQGILVRELYPLMEVLANDRTDPLAGLSMLPLPMAAPVAPADELPANVTATPILRSSPYAWHRDQMLPLTPEGAAPTPHDGATQGPFVTGVMLDGTFTSYVATKDATDANLNAELPTSPVHTRIIALGSADFVDDRVLTLAQRHPLFQALQAGAPALHTLVDWLAEDLALVAARAKAAPQPIDPLDADARRWIKYGNSVGTAALLLLIGVVAWLVRERRRRSISL